MCGYKEQEDANKLIACAYCNNSVHEKCEERELREGASAWNIYKCEGCEKDHRHPTIRGEERLGNIEEAIKIIEIYNEKRDR